MWQCVQGGEREFEDKIKTPFNPKNNYYRKKKNPPKGSQRKRWGGSQLTVNKIPEGCILMKHFAVSEIIEENPTE